MSNIFKGIQLIEQQLDELSPETLSSYKKKAGAEASALDKAAWGGAPDAQGKINKANKRFSGIIRATKKELDNDVKGIKEASNADIEDDILHYYHDEGYTIGEIASRVGMDKETVIKVLKSNPTYGDIFTPAIKEEAKELNMGDPVTVTGDVQFNGATGDIVGFSNDKHFVIVDLYNHGKRSFHSSGVSFNDYADSDDEEARMYDSGELRDVDEGKMKDIDIDRQDRDEMSPQQFYGQHGRTKSDWEGQFSSLMNPKMQKKKASTPKSSRELDYCSTCQRGDNRCVCEGTAESTTKYTVHCSQCGNKFTRDKNEGYSHCRHHSPKKKQGVAEGYDEWNARELEKSRTRHPDGTGSTPSKTLAKLMRIPGFSKVSPAEQQRVAKAVDRYLARDMSFDQALVLAQKQGVAEAGYGSNRGYTHGFASPTAPKLGGSGREDDERNSEFDSRMRAITGMIFYNNVDDPEEAMAIGLKQTSKGKWFLKTGNRLAQKVADQRFGPGKVWYPTNEAASSEVEEGVLGFVIPPKKQNTKQSTSLSDMRKEFEKDKLSKTPDGKRSNSPPDGQQFTRQVTYEQGVAEGAPELLKAEIPLVREIERSMAQHGYEKGTEEYKKVFDQMLSFHRKFGNAERINQSHIDEAGEAKPVNMKRWVRDFERREDNNFHTENVLAMAQLVGTPEDIATMKSLVKQHKGFGLSEKQFEIRHEISNRLRPLVKQKIADSQTQGVAEGFEPGHREIERWATQSEENQKIYNAYIRAGKMADDAYKQKDGAAYAGLQLLKKQIRDLIAKKMSEQDVTEAELDEECWKGYTQYGMKDKNGKKVPNCVPVKETKSNILKGLM